MWKRRQESSNDYMSDNDIHGVQISFTTKLLLQKYNPPPLHRTNKKLTYKRYKQNQSRVTIAHYSAYTIFHGGKSNHSLAHPEWHGHALRLRWSASTLRHKSTHPPYWRKETKEIHKWLGRLSGNKRMNITSVPIQTARVTKCNVANITLVASLVRMNDFVDVETARLTKALATHIASVRSGSWMNALMCCEIAALSERFMAHAANKWFKTRMNPEVFN